MKPWPIAARIALFGVALIHCAPLLGLAGGDSLRQAYGLSQLDASTELLLRHRALMFGLWGAGLLAAQQWASWRRPLLLATAISDLGFIALLLASPSAHPALQRIAYGDAVSLLLSTGLLVSLWRQRSRAAG